MTHMQSLRFAAALLVCGCSSLVLGAEGPLASIPGDADVVIRLKSPQQTIEKAASMAAQADDSLAGQIRENAPFVGLLISNPSLAGVDQERDWHVVVFAHADADPSVVFVVPATDADAQQGALAAKFAKFARDGLVYYSEDAAAVERLREPPPAAAASMTAEMDAESTKVFERGDISVFVNVDHLTEVYRDRLDSATDNLASQMSRRMGILGMVPGLNVSESVGGGTEGGKAILKDTRALATALVISDAGLNFETYADFKGDSRTAAAMEANTGHPLSNVAQLPASAVLYFGLSGRLAQNAESGLSSSLALADPTDENQAKIAKLLENMKSVKFGSFAAALGLGHRESGIIRFTSITEANPASSVRDFKRESSALMNAELEGQGIKQEAEYEAGAEKVGDHEADVLSLRTTVDPNVNPFFGSILEQIQSALFGPDGLEVRFVYWADKYLQSVGGGTAALEDAVAAVDAGTENKSAEYRQGLIEEPNVLLMIDVQRIAYRALKAAAESPDLNIPVDPAVVNAPEPDPSFVGFSLATEPHALRTKTQVPPPQLFRIVQLALFARKLQEK